MEACPCDNSHDYSTCCEPIITGTAEAPTAEALMRARYTAYAKAEITFLESSLHPDHREGFDGELAEKWAKSSEWHGLEVCNTMEGGEDDENGIVEFIAKYTDDGKATEHHEVAHFQKDEGKWYFVDGRLVQDTFRREGPKVGRNEPCPCGSGKKFKKCCAKK